MRLVVLVLVVCLLGAAPALAASPAETYLVCNHGADMTALVKPGFCNTVQPRQSLAESITLHQLRWNHWGRSSATAHARTRVKTYDPWDRVLVRAYRRVWSDCTGGWVYTRLRTTTKYGRHVWKMLDCTESAAEPVPTP